MKRSRREEREKDLTLWRAWKADPVPDKLEPLLDNLQKVIIPKKKLGDKVNLEVDVISKYVEQSLAAVVARVEALEKKLEEVSSDK